MLTPKNISVDLSGISELLGDNIPQPDKQLNKTHNENSLASVIPELNLGVVTIGKGPQTEIHLIELKSLSKAESLTPPPPEYFLEHYEKNKSATLYVSDRSKSASNRSIFNSRHGAPIPEEAHKYYQEYFRKFAKNTTGDLKIDDLIKSLKKGNLITDAFKPTKKQVTNVFINDNPNHPSTRVDIIEGASQVRNGTESFTISIAEGWSGLSESEINKREKWALAKIRVELSENHMFKNQVVDTYIEQIEQAIAISTNEKNRLSLYSSFDSGTNFKTNLEAALKHANLNTPESWNIKERDHSFKNNKQSHENYPLVFFAEALQKLGYVNVSELEKGGAMQTKHLFESISGGEQIKIKFSNRLETAQIMENLGGGSSTMPNHGLSTVKGDFLVGGEKLIRYLSSNGIIKQNPNSVFYKCLELVKKNEKSIDLEAISLASTNFDGYKTPAFKTKHEKKAFDMATEIFEWRGVSKEVMKKLLDQKVIGSTSFNSKFKPYDTLVVNLGRGLSQNAISQQRLYIDNKGSRKKLEKPFFSSGDRNGTAAVLKGKNNKGVIFTEAFIDMASAHDVVKHAGINPDDYTFASALSSGSMFTWLAESTGGYRPAKEKELKRDPNTLVYRDLTERKPIESAEEIASTLRAPLERISPITFLTNNTKENQVALAKLESIVNYVNSSRDHDEAPIQIAKTPERDTYDYPTSKEPKTVFNESNISRLIEKSGVRLNHSFQVIGCDKLQSKSEAINLEEDLLEARENIVRNLGTDRLIAFHDMDVAGLTPIKSFLGFLSKLELEGNALTLPLVSKESPQLNTRYIRDLLRKNTYKLIDVQENLSVVNDINDVAKFLNEAPREHHGIETIRKAVNHAVKNTATSRDVEWLNEVTNILGLMEQVQKHQQKRADKVENQKKFAPRRGQQFSPRR